MAHPAAALKVCPQISNGTITALIYYIDLAWGDTSNRHIIISNAVLYVTGTVEKVNMGLNLTGYCDVPAGATIYIRGGCSGTAVTGFNATAVAIGG